MKRASDIYVEEPFRHNVGGGDERVANAINNVFDMMIAKRFEQGPIVPHIAMNDSEVPGEASYVRGMSVKVIVVADNDAASSEELPDNCRSDKPSASGHHYNTVCEIMHDATPIKMTLCGT
jgi:hypothetical protein